MDLFIRRLLVDEEIIKGLDAFLLVQLLDELLKLGGPDSEDESVTDLEFLAEGAIGRLSELAEPSYCAFSKKLKVSDRLIFGIRTPKLQKLIKQLYEEEGIKALDDFFIYQEPSYEEIQIAFSLFGLLKLDYQSALSYLDRLRPFNDSWATNDNLAGWFSHLVQEKDFYRYLRSLLREQNPYDQRLGIVSLMNYYLEENSIAETLVELASVTNPHYYVVMALGWAYATEIGRAHV